MTAQVLRPVAEPFDLHGDHPLDVLGRWSRQPDFLFHRRAGDDDLLTCAAFDRDEANTVHEGNGDDWPALVDRLAPARVDWDAGLPPFPGGLALFVAHDAPREATDPIPRFRLVVLRRFVLMDASRGRGWLVRLVGPEEDDGPVRDGLRALLHGLRHDAPPHRATDRPGPWRRDTAREAYEPRVARVRQAIADDRVRQVILSIGLRKRAACSPWQFFRRIVQVNPSPQAFFVRTPAFALAGSSPLSLVQARGGRATVETDAGTRPVSADEAANRRAEAELFATPKDRHEQQLIVDATLADLAAVADGPVATTVPFEVRRFSHVMHLYTVFGCRIRAGVGPGALLAALAPPPAVVGLPKAPARALYETIEGTRRGPYGGIVALVGCDGSVDASVVLRSAWFVGGELRTRSGGGVVATSAATAEYDECLHKAQAVFTAVALAEQDAGADPHADEPAPD